jgi:hypothetical protein
MNSFQQFLANQESHTGMQIPNNMPNNMPMSMQMPMSPQMPMQMQMQGQNQMPMSMPGGMQMQGQNHMPTQNYSNGAINNGSNQFRPQNFGRDPGQNSDLVNNFMPMNNSALPNFLPNPDQLFRDPNVDNQPKLSPSDMERLMNQRGSASNIEPMIHKHNKNGAGVDILHDPKILQIETIRNEIILLKEKVNELERRLISVSQ